MERECENCKCLYVVNIHNQKYCSRKCRDSHYYKTKYKDNRRHEVICKCCGKEFRTNDKKQGYCSLSCGAASSSNKRNEETLTEREKAFAEKLEGNRGDLRYVSGYIDGEKPVTIMCLICNTTFQKGAGRFRGSKIHSVRCDNCERIEAEQKLEEKRRLIEHNQKLREKAKAERERLKKEIRLKELEKKKHYKYCLSCNERFETISKRKMYCSQQCGKREQNRRKGLRRREQLKLNGRVDYSITLGKLIKRDKGICHICNNKVDLTADSNSNEYPSIDHVFPVAKGGTHTWDNVKLAHRGCNNIKNDKIYFETESGQVALTI